MSIKFGSLPVGNSQRVAASQREQGAKKPLEVSWDRTVVNINDKVTITGVVNSPVNSPVKPIIWILFDGKPYLSINNATIQNGQITAGWIVTPKNRGEFTKGTYDVEITYSGLVGRTTTSLRIVPLGGNRDVSSFGR